MQETKSTKWDEGFGGVNGHILKLDCGDGCKTIHLLKIIELYT